MPVHRVEVSNIIAEVENRDVIFEVYADEEKMGRLTVSRGGIGWYPSNSPNERRLDWEAFDQLMRTWRGGACLTLAGAWFVPRGEADLKGL